jgi:hypothetical protein
VSRLRSELWGAGPRPAEAVKEMLARAGFTDIRVGPAMGEMVPIAAMMMGA